MNQKSTRAAKKLGAETFNALRIKSVYRGPYGAAELAGMARGSREERAFVEGWNAARRRAGVWLIELGDRNRILRFVGR